MLPEHMVREFIIPITTHIGSKILKSIKLLLLLWLAMACTEETKFPPESDFGLEQELQLGNIMRQEISDNSSQYGALLDRAIAPDPYDYLYGIMDSVMSNYNFERKDSITFEPFILDFNAGGGSPRYKAFSLPGGAHYYYVGTLNYLRGEHELAALMAKEMSHNENFDPWERLLGIYGKGLILEVINGQQPDLLSQMVQDLIDVGYPLLIEQEADFNSVDYLCGSSYSPGALGDVINRGVPDSVLMDTVFVLNPDILQQYGSFYTLDSTRGGLIISQANNQNCSGDSIYAGRYGVFLDSLNAKL